MSQILLFLGGVVLLLGSLWFVDWRWSVGVLGVLVMVFALLVERSDE